MILKNVVKLLEFRQYYFYDLEEKDGKKEKAPKKITTEKLL